MKCYYCDIFAGENLQFFSKEVFLYNSDMEPVGMSVVDYCYHCSEELQLQKTLY
jgi:hypothetical protein